MVIARFASLCLVLVVIVVIGAPLQIVLRRCRAPRVADQLQVAVSRTLCALLRLQVRATGCIPIRGPALVVPNHVSWTDVLVLGSVAPLCFLAKSEVASWPLLGWAVRAHGTLFVARRRLKQIPAVNRAMADAMRDGPPVVLFAEGTTSCGTRLGKFHTGHLGAVRDLLARSPALAEVPILPVALAYTRRGNLPAGLVGRSELAWPGDVPLLPHLWTLLRDGPVRCDLVWCDPVAYARGADRKVVGRAVRGRVRQSFVALVAGRETVNSRPAAIWSAPTMQPAPHLEQVPGPVS